METLILTNHGRRCLPCAANTPKSNPHARALLQTDRDSQDANLHPGNSTDIRHLTEAAWKGGAHSQVSFDHTHPMLRECMALCHFLMGWLNGTGTCLSSNGGSLKNCILDGARVNMVGELKPRLCVSVCYSVQLLLSFACVRVC